MFLGDRPAGLFHRSAQVGREINEIHGHLLIVGADATNLGQVVRSMTTLGDGASLKVTRASGAKMSREREGASVGARGDGRQ